MMIITREMYDEFVESAENHTILWTDTLKLIGVTVGDVPDVDVIEALEANERIAVLGTQATIRVLYADAVDARAQNEAQAAEIARLREALGRIARLEGVGGPDAQLQCADMALAALAQETQP